MIRRAYVRHRESLPDNPSSYAAVEGFRQLGVETAPFYGFGDIEEISDLSEEVAVFGFIGDTWAALARMGRERPEPVDYPEELSQYLGRKVWRTTLDKIVNRGPDSAVFVKPVRHKLFTGRVWTNSGADRLASVQAEPDEPVWCSEVVELVSEHRCFVLEDQILDVRRYKGDWSMGPDKRTVESAAMAYGKAPAAYAADFGITREGRTILVEVNDSFALGSYGLDPVYYARMMSARWEQMARGSPT